MWWRRGDLPASLQSPARWTHLEDCMLGWTSPHTVALCLELQQLVTLGSQAKGIAEEELSLLWRLRGHRTLRTRAVRFPFPFSAVLGAGECYRWMWTRLCAVAQTVLTHLCGKQPWPPGCGRGSEVPCRTRWEQLVVIPPSAGAGWTGVFWSKRCCAPAWSLPVVLYPVSPSSLARYPQLLLKAEGVSSPTSPLLLWYVASGEAVN